MIENQGFHLDSVNLLLTTKQNFSTSIYLQIIFQADGTFLSQLHQPVVIHTKCATAVRHLCAGHIPCGEDDVVKIPSSVTALVNICIDRLPVQRKPSGTTPVVRGTAAADVFPAAAAHWNREYSAFWQSGSSVGG